MACVLPSDQTDLEQNYYPESGHSFSGEGVSYCEWLGLFGYPLSEPMIETNGDSDTVLTQYFERAVFEYHLDIAAPFQVFLRCHGAEVLKSWGW